MAYVPRQSAIQLEMAKGMSQFNMNLYHLFSGKEANVFMSPYSVCAALLLANLGTKGDTEREIRSALGLGSINQKDVHWEFHNIQEGLKDRTKGSTVLAVANRLFARLGLEVLETYKTESQKLYGAGIESLDFLGEPEQSRSTINQWVEEKTERKIRDLLPPKSINDMSLLVLVNAIYFKGKWKKPFEKEMTNKQKFYPTPNTSVSVDMMHATLKLNLHRDKALGCSAVEIPYESNNIGMVIILPDKIEGLSALEDKLKGDVLYHFCNVLHTKWETKVILALPKFKLEATYNMTEAMGQLGIKTMTNAARADFGAMLKSPENAFISEVIHKAYVEVSEEGTEAAAATAMMMMLGCAPTRQEPEKFIADHPFIFLIRDALSGTVLFLGRFATPTQH